jgi:hypothetical protein
MHSSDPQPVLRIRDVFTGSEFFPPRIPDLYFNPKNLFLNSRKYESGCGIPDFYTSQIPDPGVKKAPDPGSATLKIALVRTGRRGRGRVGNFASQW